jgi:hypothetical protein
MAAPKLRIVRYRRNNGGSAANPAPGLLQHHNYIFADRQLQQHQHRQQQQQQQQRARCINSTALKDSYFIRAHGV